MGKLLTEETSIWYESRTLWISFIVFAATGLQAFGVDIPIPKVDGATMGIILSAIFFVLRLVTKKPVNG